MACVGRPARNADRADGAHCPKDLHRARFFRLREGFCVPQTQAAVASTGPSGSANRGPTRVAIDVRPRKLRQAPWSFRQLLCTLAEISKDRTNELRQSSRRRFLPSDHVRRWRSPHERVSMLRDRVPTTGARSDKPDELVAAGRFKHFGSWDRIPAGGAKRVVFHDKVVVCERWRKTPGFALGYAVTVFRPRCCRQRGRKTGGRDREEFEPLLRCR